MFLIATKGMQSLLSSHLCSLGFLGTHGSTILDIIDYLTVKRRSVPNNEKVMIGEYIL
jgi:hypothetical protein